MPNKKNAVAYSRLARESRRDQGKPTIISDDVALRRIAALLDPKEQFVAPSTGKDAA